MQWDNHQEVHDVDSSKGVDDALFPVLPSINDDVVFSKIPEARVSPISQKMRR
jgi:hypothetical protein